MANPNNNSTVRLLQELLAKINTLMGEGWQKNLPPETLIRWWQLPYTTWFSLSEGEAFLEATFDSRLEYKDRKAKIAEYGEPDCTCPKISSVMAATLPNTTINGDKLAFQTQEMYMKVVVPLTALLENTGDESFTLKEAIPMIQSAIQLLGDAAQHHSSQRRKAIMQHLNPQLQILMKDEDFKGSQPSYLERLR